jgi:hypothetical protein
MMSSAITTGRQSRAGPDPAAVQSYLLQSSPYEERRTVDFLAIEFALVVIT